MYISRNKSEELALSSQYTIYINYHIIEQILDNNYNAHTCTLYICVIKINLKFQLNQNLFDRNVHRLTVAFKASTHAEILSTKH